MTIVHSDASRTDEPDRPPDTIPVLVGALTAALARLLKLVRPAQAKLISATVAEVSDLLTRLLELVISQAAGQAATVASRLIARQKAAERRLETQASEISHLHLRLDTRGGQIDEQEQRIAALERERAVGGGAGDE